MMNMKSMLPALVILLASPLVWGEIDTIGEVFVPERAGTASTEGDYLLTNMVLPAGILLSARVYCIPGESFYITVWRPLSPGPTLSFTLIGKEYVKDTPGFKQVQLNILTEDGDVIGVKNEDGVSSLSYNFEPAYEDTIRFSNDAVSEFFVGQNVTFQGRINVPYRYSLEATYDTDASKYTIPDELSTVTTTTTLGETIPPVPPTEGTISYVGYPLVETEKTGSVSVLYLHSGLELSRGVVTSCLAYFTTVDPAWCQIWRPVSDQSSTNSFALVYQLQMDPVRLGASEFPLSKGSYFFVEEGDVVGFWTNAAIPYTFTQNSGGAQYVTFPVGGVAVDDVIAFTNINLPYQFSVGVKHDSDIDENKYGLPPGATSAPTTSTATATFPATTTTTTTATTSTTTSGTTTTTKVAATTAEPTSSSTRSTPSTSAAVPSTESTKMTTTTSTVSTTPTTVPKTKTIIMTTTVPTTTAVLTSKTVSTATTVPIKTTTRTTATVPTTSVPTTSVPTTSVPTTSVPTTAVPTTAVPTISVPTTAVPTISVPTTAVSTSTSTVPTQETLESTTSSEVDLQTLSPLGPTPNPQNTIGLEFFKGSGKKLADAASRTFILAPVVFPSDGKVIEFWAYFNGTERVQLEVWRMNTTSGDSSFQLIGSKMYTPTNKVGLQQITVEEDLLVQKGDLLGFTHENESSSLTYIFEVMPLYVSSPWTSFPELGQSDRFTRLDFPYNFQMVASYIPVDNSHPTTVSAISSSVQQLSTSSSNDHQTSDALTTSGRSTSGETTTSTPITPAAVVDESDSWLDSRELTLALLIWLIVLTVFFLIFCCCFCCRKHEQKNAERSPYSSRLSRNSSAYDPYLNSENGIDYFNPQTGERPKMRPEENSSSAGSSYDRKPLARKNDNRFSTSI